MAIDWEAAKSGKRPVKRGDGCECRFLSKLKGGDRCAVAILEPNGIEYVHAYLADGRPFNNPASSVMRLIQEPEVIEFKRWVNVYEDGNFRSHDSPEYALGIAGAGAVAKCVPIIVRITGNKIVIHGESE